MALKELMKMAGEEIVDKPSAQTTNARIRRDNTDILSVKNILQETCDPFDESSASCDKLLNISSGKTAPSNVQNYLTNLLDNGKIARQKFEEECLDDPKRFLKPIKRQNVLNFAKSNQKTSSQQKLCIKLSLCVIHLLI